jgi:hypothetical protein
MTNNPASPLPARRSRHEEVLPAEPEFAAVETTQGIRDMLELANDSLGGHNFNVINLQKIRASKEGFFETAEGTQTERELKAIVLANRQARIYWGRSYNPGATKEPPACTSNDGFRGVGNPGGLCATCPYSAFKSARNPDGSQAAGQACKELRQLLVLLPGHMIPHLLTIQPTSVRGFDKYILTLASGSSSYWGAVTRFSIEIVPASGYPVARVLFSLAKRLAPEQKQLLRPYHEKMRDLLTPMTVDASAYETAEPSRQEAQNYPFEDEPEPPAPKIANPDDIPF